MNLMRRKPGRRSTCRPPKDSQNQSSLSAGYSGLFQFASSSLRRKLGLPDRQTVVYLAANAKPPHRAGLAWVRRLAERMPGCTFLIVGGIFGAPERQNNVIATVRIEDPASYLQAADISLCPIEFGGGTKIKMIESLAVGLPTVVFEETRFGTNTRHGEHLWVVEKNEEHIYSGLSLLLQDKALYRKLSREGRRYVMRNHEWRDSSARLEESLMDIVSTASVGPLADKR